MSEVHVTDRQPDIHIPEFHPHDDVLELAEDLLDSNQNRIKNPITGGSSEYNIVRTQTPVIDVAGHSNIEVHEAHFNRAGELETTRKVSGMHWLTEWVRVLEGETQSQDALQDAAKYIHENTPETEGDK